MGSWWLFAQIAVALLLAYLLGAMLGCGLRRLHDYVLRDRDDIDAVGAGVVAPQPVIEVSGGASGSSQNASRFERALSHGPGGAAAAAGVGVVASGRGVAGADVDQVKLDTPSFSPIENTKDAAAASGAPTMDEIARELRAADQAELRSSLEINQEPEPDTSNEIKTVSDAIVSGADDGNAPDPVETLSVDGEPAPEPEGEPTVSDAEPSGSGGVEGEAFTAVSVAAAAAAAAASAVSGSVRENRTDDEPQKTSWSVAAVDTVRIDEQDTAAANDELEPVSISEAAGSVASGVASGDDLTRIKGIDETVHARLVEGGVTRYEQIAGWQSNDVAEVEAFLAMPEVVSQRNWIEQADILARGDSTVFAQMKDSGGTPSDAVESPVSDSGASGRVLDVERFGDGDRSSIASDVTPVDLPVADNDDGRDGVTSSSSETAAGWVVTAAAATAATVAASVATTDDDVGIDHGFDPLTRIAGLDDHTAGLLNASGITRFDQIANWSDRDVGHYEGLLGAPGRVERERWIVQARHLGSVDAVPTDVVSAPATPPESEVEIRTDTESDEPVSDEGARKRETEGRTSSNYSGFRSVRSRALRGAGSATHGVVFDDLKRVRGVGVLIEKKLNSLGVTNFEHVANWTKDDIDRVSQLLGFKGRIEQENWVEQARILAAGGQTEFSRRMDRADKI